MLLLALLLAAPVGADASTCVTKLETGRNAYGVYDVRGARTIFETVAADSCPAQIRGEAETELARIEWLVDGASSAAASRLRRVVRVQPDPCATARLLGRILNASNQSAEVPTALAPLKNQCAALEPELALEIVQAHIAEAARADRRQSSAALAAAREELDRAPELARASLTGARQKLAIGLLAQDAEYALQGWRDFYWLDGGAVPQAFEQQDIENVFRTALRSRSSANETLALATVLIRGGFANEAERLAVRDTGSPHWRNVHVYLDMRRRLEALLLSHDRAWAQGDRSGDEQLEAKLLAVLREAVAAAGRPADDPWSALRELWGLTGTTGRSNGVNGLHLGHVSIDKAQAIAQGRRQGDIRFVALDNMIANGFSGWLGDGNFAPGGWAADGRMIQVRARYVQKSMAWPLVAVPGAARDRYLQNMRDRTAADRSLTANDAIVYLPGLADRMRLKAIDAVAAELRSEGVTDDVFARRFMRSWYELDFDGTILLHEGRHILDQKDYVGARELKDAELEYRAKLSELGYSRSPRLQLSSIYGRLLGGTSGHGIANERLLRDYVGWMKSHPRQVSGFDAIAPALPQIDKLTDQQIQAIARDLDPELKAHEPAKGGDAPGRGSNPSTR